MGSVIFLRGAGAWCVAAMVVGAAVAGPGEPGAVPPGGQGVNVYSAVAGRAAVFSALPEGARVKKGDVVCTLDSTEFEERWVARTTLVEAAEADLRGARIDREMAEAAVGAFVEGAYRQELLGVQGEVRSAEADQARARDQLEWSNRMYRKGYLSAVENLDDTIAAQQANFALERAQAKRQGLETHTKEKATKALEGAVEKAKALELTKRAALERAQAARARLARQVASCKVVAPADGRVHYPTPLEAGVLVRRGQWLFRVVAGDAANAQAK